jgi:hypothetical protein
VIIEQLDAVGVEAESDAVGVGHVLRAHRGGAPQQDARRPGREADDKLLEGDAGAVAPGAVQQKCPLSILRAEWLARHARAVLEKPRPAQWKLLLGLAAVGISDGVNSQLIEIHHRQVGTDGWLRVGRDRPRQRRSGKAAPGG